MIKVIAIIGKAGSGKDTLLRELMEQSPIRFHEIVSYTTRPPRKGEADGKNYHFVSNEEFFAMKNSNQLLEYAEFNGWYYGTARVGLSEDKINVGVFNPTGVRSLKNNRDIELSVYYLRADDSARLERQLHRIQNVDDLRETLRRFSADEEDFKDLSDIDYIPLTNNRSYDIPFMAGYIIGQNSKII